MILRGSVFSQTLQMNTGITVVMPQQLKPEGGYRVVYLLHGLCGESEDFVNYTMLPAYAWDYDAVFIMPEVQRSFYTDMKYGLKYFTYVIEELPQICQSVFKISAKREDTFIMGCSMGGYGALKCALTKPEQYAGCCSFSAPCLFLKEGMDAERGNEHLIVEDFRAIFGDDLEWKPEYEILELAKRVEVQKEKPFIYSYCGIQDDLRGINVRFKDEMNKLNFNFSYEEWEGCHNWKFFNEALGKALKVALG